MFSDFKSERASITSGNFTIVIKSIGSTWTISTASNGSNLSTQDLKAMKQLFRLGIGMDFRAF